MRKKIVLEVDESNMVYAKDGVYLCNITPDQTVEFIEADNDGAVLKLAALGYSAEDIIKLKTTGCL